MDTISYLIHVIIYDVILSLLFLPCILALVYIKSLCIAHGIQIPQVLLVFLYFPVLGWYLFASPWLSHKAAKYRVFSDEPFWSALNSARCDGQFYLAFIPIAGKFFYRHESSDSFQDEVKKLDDRTLFD